MICKENTCLKKLIIIPAFNEEKNIVRTVENIKASAPSFDYVIINDCSTDGTRRICEENKYNIVNLPINLGIGGAVQTGYKYAFRHHYDMAVQVDGDGQHNPCFLEKMSEKLVNDDLDMVIGSRFITKEGFQSSPLRRIGIVYFTKLIKLLTGKTITDPTSGLRMVNRKIIEQFANDYPTDYPEPESVVAVVKKGRRIEEIPVIMEERKEGVSSISAHKSVYYMIKVSLTIFIERIRREK